MITPLSSLERGTSKTPQSGALFHKENGASSIEITSTFNIQDKSYPKFIAKPRIIYTYQERDNEVEDILLFILQQIH